MLNKNFFYKELKDAESSLIYEPSFCDLYNLTFEVIKADTPELLEQVYKLRYQIYCVENRYEDPSEHLDGLETDAYDAHSVHYLLMHRASGLAVGTMRMVLPIQENVLHSLPIQEVCTGIPELMDPKFMARTGEISRFCISEEMRRRITDGDFPDVNSFSGLPYIPDRRVLSCAFLGLIRACIDVAHENDIDEAYLICEPILLRLLGKVGIGSTPRGPLVEYHGKRQPVLIDNDTKLLTKTAITHPDVWSVLSDNGRLKPRVRK